MNQFQSTKKNKIGEGRKRASQTKGRGHGNAGPRSASTRPPPPAPRRATRRERKKLASQSHTACTTQYEMDPYLDTDRERVNTHGHHPRICSNRPRAERGLLLLFFLFSFYFSPPHRGKHLHVTDERVKHTTPRARRRISRSCNNPTPPCPHAHHRSTQGRPRHAPLTSGQTTTVTKTTADSSTPASNRHRIAISALPPVASMGSQSRTCLSVVGRRWSRRAGEKG